MTDPQFFGYGSLVNTRTHAYPNARQAEVEGWRRIWRSIAGRHHAVLSVERAPDTTLQGLIAQVPGADWQALDAREGLYVRQRLPDGTAIYEVQDRIVATPAPILRSYLDVVIQGYQDHFGVAGVDRFFASTHNWSQVMDDRAAPLYPRHQNVGAGVTALVDQRLAAMVE